MVHVGVKLQKLTNKQQLRKDEPILEKSISLCAEIKLKQQQQQQQ